MKHRELTHRAIEKIMFWASLLFFVALGALCFLSGMPQYVSAIMFAIPVIMAFFTFIPPLEGCIQAYAMVICAEVAATTYAFANNNLSTMHGVFLMIMCCAALYRRIGLTVCQMVYVGALYTVLYLLYPEKFFDNLEMPFSAIIRLILFYVGGISIICMIAWFRNAVKVGELRNQSVTDLYKEVEKERQKAEAGTQEKADFLANMSHEMRTPMIAVCGMSELLLQNNLTPLEEEYVTTIQNSANNLLSMVNDILDFSKIEANMMDLEEAPYKLESLIADVTNIINVRIGEKSVAFVVELDPNLPATLTGDEARIRQILINLLNNAVKFTDRGQIKLKINYSMDEWNHSWLTIVVSDTGIGITRENQKLLFSQFTQVDTDHNRSIEGTGLGLVISQRLARKMNGNITVQSEYGKGSQFTVVIEQKVTDATELAFVPDPDGYVAYIYEPNDCYRENLKRMMESLGVPTITVSDIAIWDYYNADRFGAMLFFDYSSGIASVNTFALKLHRMRLITVIDRNTFVDAGIKDNILMLHKPVLTGQLASLIRGENLDDFRREKKRTTHIFVPDARIMVVDDNYVNLRVTAGLLNIFKPQVVMVSSGREAYELLQKDRSFDMVFMDHMMPDWDGVETVGHIRALKDEYYRKLPIIALTANVTQDARDMFIQNGMNDFVGKPMSADTLAAVLKKYIAPQKQLSEYAEKVDPMMTRNRPRDEYISAVTGSESKKIEIPGIDTARGVFNMGGSADAYNHILNVFIEDGRDKLVYLEKYAEEGNIKAYTIEAHSLKSVAASIGALGLSELAKQHEAAARNGDMSFIKQHYGELIGQYTAVLCDVDKYLVSNNLVKYDAAIDDEDNERSVQPISTQKKHNSVVEIIRLIERFDSDAAIDGINTLLRYRLDKGDRSALKKAVSQLNDYMFDDAIQTLSPL